MKRFLFGVLLLASMVSAAMADEASDFQAAAGAEARAYGDCTSDYAKPRLQSSEAPEAIADGAAKACDAKLGAIKVALMNGVTHLSDEKASKVVADLLAGSRANLMNLIRKAR